MIDAKPLPPGQRARDDFPRFGLTPYAYRFPTDTNHVRLALTGDAIDGVVLDAPFAGLQRVEQTCDFHCVTTWSREGLRWSGFGFREFYNSQIAPRVKSGCEIRTVLLRGQDGYRSTLPLSDLLADDVMFADRLDGQPLSVEHGAPLRLIAPAHYGYKSIKHIATIACWQTAPVRKTSPFAFMDHPRARVALEERGRWFPGWLLRFAYRPLIRSTIARFATAMKSWHSGDEINP